MIRVGALLGASFVGLLVGAGLMISIDELTATPAPSNTAATDRLPLDTVADGVLLLWTPGGLPAGIDGDLTELPGVDAVTVVHGGLVSLVESRDANGQTVTSAPEDMVIPLDTIAVDPDTYAPFTPKPALGALDLEPTDAVLGATSARIRGVAVGSSLRLDDGTTLRVAGVVDDTVVGAAELVVAHSGSNRFGLAPRYALIRHRGERAETEHAIRQLLSDTAVRVRSAGETPFLRHGDAVLPQAFIKEQFGEFAITPGDTEFVQDETWETTNIINAEVPILGEVRCHRTLIESLRGAMAELEKRNLAFLVDADSFGGCWNPRFTRNHTGLSRHAWGAAVDLNAGKNPTGLESVQDPRLVEVMGGWGFTWGGNWLVPDPAHFEYLQPP